MNDYHLFATYDEGHLKGEVFWQQPMNTWDVISNLQAWCRVPGAMAYIDPENRTHLYLRHIQPGIDAAWVIQAPSELAAAMLLHFWNQEQSK